MIVPSFFTCISPVELGKFFPQKEHLKVFGVSVDSLPDLLRFPFRLAQHQNVIETNGALDVPRDNPALVSAFEDTDSHLYHFACYASASYDLGYFSGYECFF
jgi:hypothetical protein